MKDQIDSAAAMLLQFTGRKVEEFKAKSDAELVDLAHLCDDHRVKESWSERMGAAIVREAVEVVMSERGVNL
jgi:hypothetical protein